MILINGTLISRNPPPTEDQYEYPCLLVYINNEIRYAPTYFTHLYGETIESIFDKRSSNKFIILHKLNLIDNNEYYLPMTIVYWKDKDTSFKFI